MGNWGRALPLVIVAAGIWAYHNSFAGPFIFDDISSIERSERLHQLWPLWHTLAGTQRPIPDLSFAVNVALGGPDVSGYHAVNLAIHLVAGLVLFGLVRRTLETPACRGRYGSSAAGLALTTALLWVVHPLQTASVTYISQRAEALMGAFYLLTLYCVLRGSSSPQRLGWFAAAVGACAAGMGSKPVMVTAPAVVLLYDRCFLSQSVREAFRQRWGVYAGLAATWGLLLVFQWDVIFWDAYRYHTADVSAGFGVRDVTPLAYAMTQPGVLLHYLRLAVWPHPLVLDYGWPIARSVRAVLPQALVIGALLVLTLWALRRRPGLGFLGAACFLILAPTSSLIPITDPAFEHRMYLPLAGMVILAVLGGHAGLHRLVPAERPRRQVATTLLAALVVALGLVTIRRNADYRTAFGIWTDTLMKRPGNARAYLHIGRLLQQEGRLDEAAGYYTAGLQVDPDDAGLHNNLGGVRRQQGRYDEAVTQYLAGLRLKPHAAEVRNNLGFALVQLGRLDEAIAQYTEAIRLKPHAAEMRFNLAAALERRGDLPAAIRSYAAAVRLHPDSPHLYTSLGRALARQGELAEAIAMYTEALRLDPGLADAHHHLGLLLVRQHRLEEAVTHFTKATQLRPDHPEARRKLEAVMAQLGRGSP